MFSFLIGASNCGNVNTTSIECKRESPLSPSSPSPSFRPATAGNIESGRAGPPFLHKKASQAGLGAAHAGRLRMYIHRHACRYACSMPDDALGMLWGCFGDVGAALEEGYGLQGQEQDSRSDGRASLRCGVGTEEVGDGMFSVGHGVVRTFLSSCSSFPLEENQNVTYSLRTYT